MDRTDGVDRVLSRLTAGDLVEVVRFAADAMVAHAPALDRLDAGSDGNGNTGSHAAAALSSVADAVGSCRSLNEFAAAVPTAADPSLGRAGGLLFSFLGGVADVCRNTDAVDAGRLALALEAGAEAASHSIASPRPGGLDAVARAVAEAALAASDHGAALAPLVLAAAEAGLDALERTPTVWEPLADAGVVDAGGAGLMVVIEALVAVVHGDDPDPPAWEFDDDTDTDTDSSDRTGRYVVEMLVTPERAGAGSGASVLDSETAARRLRRAWVALGDGVAIDASGPSLVASVSTDEIGAVIESALVVGRPSRIVVSDRRG
ncbi:MAG TPA: DAK2 domain-containing protein [Microthrixaceae bacterium]|nr:DAK2 domain-containing protein [Microthrixaceae bacterium]HMT24872.1 DAK2 domain-containing protein [Microthrixaceae bacterium]